MDGPFMVSGIFDQIVPPPFAGDLLYTHVVDSLLQNQVPPDVNMAITPDTYQITMPIQLPEEWILNTVMDLSMEDVQQHDAGVTDDNWTHLCNASKKSCKRVKYSPCDCCVCMEPIKRRFMLPCGHAFHRKCIRKWLQENNTCPVCRANVIEETVLV